MKRLTTIILLLLTVLLAVKAQIVEPVKWTHQSRMEGETLILTFTATIEPSYHLYGTEIPDGGPQRTEFVYENLQGASAEGDIRLTAGEQLRHHDDAFDMELSYFERSVTFEQRFHLTGEAYTIEGYVCYMSCNNEMCTPPTRYEFTVNSSQVASSQVENCSTDYLTTKSDLWTPVIKELQALNGGDNALPTEAQRSWWYILIAGFLAGLIALVTPCVWPMIPMTVSFFLKRTKSRAKSIRDAYTYGILRTCLDQLFPVPKPTTLCRAFDNSSSYLFGFYLKIPFFAPRYLVSFTCILYLVSCILYLKTHKND